LKRAIEVLFGSVINYYVVNYLVLKWKSVLKTWNLGTKSVQDFMIYGTISLTKI
jgi:hypothetical protein